MRVALITACYGAYDPVRPLPEDHGFDEAILITDQKITVDGWRVHLEPSDESPRLAAKRAKMMPWLYTDCDAAVWLDASFEVLGSGFAGFARAALEQDDFVVWQHPEGRVDITDEAQVSMTLKKYQGSHIKEQAAFYKQQGFPENWGLFAAGTIGWRFTPTVKRFGSLWLRECHDWSIQDQVSLPYLLWSEGMKFGIWQANEYQNPFLALRWDQRPNPDA